MIMNCKYSVITVCILTNKGRNGMKNLFFILFVLSVFWVPSQGFSQKTLTFTTADNQEHPRSIAMNAVLTEVFTRMGIKLKIVAMPSKRSLINADKGIEDGNFLRTQGISAKFPNLIMIPERLSVNNIVAFSKHQNIQVNGWKSLNDYHVVCVNGWRNCARELPDPKQKTIVKDEKLLFTLLEKDRADLGIFGRSTGLKLLDEMGIANIKALDPPVAVSGLFLYINKKHESLIPNISGILRQMKNDGTYQKILSNAGIE